LLNKHKINYSLIVCLHNTKDYLYRSEINIEVVSEETIAKFKMTMRYPRCWYIAACGSVRVSQCTTT